MEPEKLINCARCPQNVCPTEEFLHGPDNCPNKCNPISQAEILNQESTEFNLMMGLCVGHDALFLKHCRALTTVFAVKDRLLGHNPLAAIYLSRSYYRRLHSHDLAALEG